MAETLNLGTDGNWGVKKDSLLAYNSENGNFKPLPFDFTRASSATVVNKDGLIEIVGSGKARIDFKDDAKGALLLEPLATNVIVNSNTPNSSSNVVVNTNNSISPDGSLNAFKLTANSGTSLKLVDANGTSSGTYRFSVFAKKDTHNIIQLGGGGIVGHANFNLETGEYSSNGSMDYYGNGWYRCTVQFSAGIPTSHYVSFSDSLSANRLSTSVSTGSFFLYGMQSETTSFTTSYIPTQGSAVTRVADVCNNAGNNQVINSTEGVLYAELSFLSNVPTTEAISLTNGSTSERIVIYKWVSSNQIRVRVFKGGVNQAELTNTVSDITSINKIAFKYKENDFALWINGINVANTQTGLTPVGLNELGFNDNGDSGSLLNANVKDLRVYNTALTDAELQALTQ